MLLEFVSSALSFDAVIHSIFSRRIRNICASGHSVRSTQRCGTWSGVQYFDSMGIWCRDKAKAGLGRFSGEA